MSVSILQALWYMVLIFGPYRGVEEVEEVVAVVVVLVFPYRGEEEEAAAVVGSGELRWHWP